MRTIPHAWLTHPGTVERRTGADAYSDTYSAPVTVQFLRRDGARVLRDNVGADQGSPEVVSGTMLYYHPDIPEIPEGSRVTLDGRPHRVTETGTQRAFGPAAYRWVALT